MTHPNDPNESNEEIAERNAFERYQEVMYAAANRITAHFDEDVQVGEVYESMREESAWSFDLTITIDSTNDKAHAREMLAARLDKIASVLRSRMLGDNGNRGHEAQRESEEALAPEGNDSRGGTFPSDSGGSSIS